MISAQVSSAGATGEPTPSATAMPMRVQVSTSMCEPTRPVCEISLSLGSFSSSGRGNCVRSRMSTSTSASRRRIDSWPMPLTVLVNTLAFRCSSLAPDMLPFPKQIQIASDNAKGCVARLAGVEIPKYEDNEASLAELKARIAKTIDFVKSVPVESFAGAETRAVELPQRNREPLRFDGETYLKHFALPN